MDAHSTAIKFERGITLHDSGSSSESWSALTTWRSPTGLGMLPASIGEARLCYAAACFCFEAVASVLGLTIGLDIERTELPPSPDGWRRRVWQVSGLLVLNAAMGDGARHPRSSTGLTRCSCSPFLLCLDNLTAGIGLGVSGSQVLRRRVGHRGDFGLDGDGGIRPRRPGPRPRILISPERWPGTWLLACAGWFGFFVDLS